MTLHKIYSTMPDRWQAVVHKTPQVGRDKLPGPTDGTNIQFGRNCAQILLYNNRGRQHAWHAQPHRSRGNASFSLSCCTASPLHIQKTSHRPVCHWFFFQWSVCTALCVLAPWLWHFGCGCEHVINTRRLQPGGKHAGLPTIRDSVSGCSVILEQPVVVKKNVAAWPQPATAQHKHLMNVNTVCFVIYSWTCLQSYTCSFMCNCHM